MPEIINRTEKRVHLNQIEAHPANPNDGDVAAIAESIRQNGFYGRIVVPDSTGRILAGEHRWRAAQEVGLAEVPIERVECDDETAMRILLADNATAEKAEREPEPLAELLESLETTSDGLAGTGYDDGDLDELLDDLGRIPENGTVDDPGAEVSRAEELQEDWGTERDQLWRIGDHRLLCGDATDEGDVGRLLDGAEPRLMWADPPYGIDFQSNHRQETPQFRRIRGDDKPMLGFLPHVASIPVWYVCCRWDVAPEFMAAITSEGHDLKNWIVWHKPGGGMGDLEGQYRPTHETILFATDGRQTFEPNGRDEDLWEMTGDDVNDYQHPTQKPVPLAQRALQNHTTVGGEIYDPCAASGMSIIAAENEGRTCYAMETDPGYCAVILDRCSEAGLKCELTE